MNGNILLLGPSGAGKTTISNEIIKHNKDYNLFVADTSRVPRIGEIHGKDYYFILQEEIINKFQEIEKYYIEEYHKNYYGYDLSGFSSKTNLILSPGINVAESLLNMKKEFGFRLFVLLSIDLNTFKKRLEGRGDSDLEISKRVKSLEFLDLKDKVDVVIDGTNTVENIRSELLNVIKNLDF